MLFGGNLVEDDGFAFGIHVGVEREFQLGSVWMEEVASDTRALRPGGGPAPCTHVVMFMLEGTLRFHGRPQAFVGPTAFVVPFSALDGRDDPRTTFRVGGPGRTQLVELRLDAHHLVKPTSEIVSLTTDAQLHSIVRRTFDGLWAGRDQATRVTELLSASAERSIVTGELGASMVHVESLEALRTWNAIAPFVGIEPPSLTELARRAALSERQLARDLEVLGKEFPKRSFRWTNVLQAWRLRYAMLLLSLPRFSIAEIARRAGYGSVEALAHAFKRAGMGTPSEVRRIVTEPLV